MQELPPYFENFSRTLSVELIEVLASIENSFELIAYDKHEDKIQEAMNYPEGVTDREMTDEALVYYRAAIADALVLQGITLIDPVSEKMDVLSTLLHAIALLGTQPLEELIDDSEIEEEDSDLSYFASVVGQVADMPTVLVLKYIEDVRPETVEVLKKGLELKEVEEIISTKYRDRFMKAVGNNKEGIVCDVVRELGHMGFDLPTIRNLVADDISELTDDDAVIREIRLLVMGSSTPVEEFDIVIGETVELLFEPKRAFKLLAKIPV